MDLSYFRVFADSVLIHEWDAAYLPSDRTELSDSTGGNSGTVVGGAAWRFEAPTETHVANLTIDGTTPSATHTNFPKLIRGQDFPTELWDAVSPDGGDIRFFLSDGTTEIPREVVKCEPLTQFYDLEGESGTPSWLTVVLGSFTAASGKLETGNTQETHLATINSVSGADVVCSADVVGVGGNHQIGLIFRHSGPNDFWLYRISTSNSVTQLYKFVSGSATLVSSGLAISSNTTYNLKVITSGNSIQTYLDGVSDISTSDSFNSTATTLGFRGNDDQDTIENIKIFNGTVDLGLSTAEIWALIPTLTAGLSGTDDTVIQIHADGVSSDYAATDTYGSQAVWVDYGYVSHDGGITESTGNASAPTLDGTSAATGKIGDATEFNGSADEVRVPFNAAFGNVFASGGTFTAWARSDSNGVNSDFGRLFQIENSAGQAAPYIGIAGDDSDELQFITRSGGAFANWIGSTNLVSASGFQHLAVSYDGSSNSNNPLMWVNGVSETVTKNVSPGSFMETATNDLYIGNRDGGDRGFDGVIDEFRLIDTELSSFWIADEYSDQDGDSDWHNITAVTSGYSISLDAGTVVLAGQTVDFDYTPNVNSYFIDLEAGTVSLVGDEINLLSQRSIGLEAGEVALDGQAVTLTYNQILNSYTIDLDAGTVTLSGGDIETALARALIAEAGTVQLGGAEVQLRRQALLELDAGEIELSGAEIELAKQVFI